MSGLQPPPPPPPRYLPTLTEVVHAVPLRQAGDAIDDSASVVGSGVQDGMAQRVLRRLDPILERRVQEAVSRLVLDHIQTLTAQLREELAEVVRQCVLQAIEHEAAQADFLHDRA